MSIIVSLLFLQDQPFILVESLPLCEDNEFITYNGTQLICQTLRMYISALILVGLHIYVLMQLCYFSCAGMQLSSTSSSTTSRYILLLGSLLTNFSMFCFQDVSVLHLQKEEGLCV